MAAKMNALTQAETQINRDIWEMKLKHGFANLSQNGCLIWKGGTMKNGYPAIRVKRLYQPAFSISGHQFAYFLQKDRFLDTRLEISHRCHNKLCVNYQHLSQETRSTNGHRNTCKTSGTCSGHGHFQDCIL